MRVGWIEQTALENLPNQLLLLGAEAQIPTLIPIPKRTGRISISSGSCACATSAVTALTWFSRKDRTKTRHGGAPSSESNTFSFYELVATCP